MAELAPDAEIGLMPAAQLAAMIAAKKISPVEATAAIIARVERLDPELNAFVKLDAEGAMAAARQAEAAVMRGDELGPLHGLTVTIKDVTAAKGLPLERGSLAHKGEIAAADAPVTARMRDAGAIVLGKTTTSEFGWTAVSRSPASGITHNPWKKGMNAGASSAGAAAAAGAGFGALHQGSDGAGSVRLPGHFSGIVGFKPGFGRVPYAPPGNNDYMSHIGPDCRTVADAALMFHVMAGHHHLDFTTLDGVLDARPEKLVASVKGLRVAYSPDLGLARVDPEVAELVAAAARKFEELGAIVQEVPTPWAAPGPEIVRGMWSAHMGAYVHLLPEWADKMDPGLVACITSALDMKATDYVALRGRKHLYSMACNAWFEDWDLLLTPAASVAAFPVERLAPEHWPEPEWDWLSWAEFSHPFNMAQNPAISVPCGLTPSGLPVGLQIVGRRTDDLGVLRAAMAFEAAGPWLPGPAPAAHG
ncbi:amidase [Rhodovarius crocodyli]|uniref:Amidase n=1 Tax=Rhodovarius crocodyli TaxID=1979269 RepID=A0A437MND7_9PROT|nr:amidase family protein [Rhodovarius crocodyli]RVT99164.1 amidase [Rhodovarius crocodyli]